MSGTPFLSAHFVLLSGVVLVLVQFLLFGMFRKKAGAAGNAEAVPSPPAARPLQDQRYMTVAQPVPRSSYEKRDMVMAAVRQLESYLDRINAAGVRDEERVWQNKLRAELEGIKRSADAGDFSAAKRRLSSAEMYVKMLELHLAGR